MGLDWQNFAALLMVALAAGYLTWQGKRSWSSRSKPGCGNCGNCPAPRAEAGPALVPLEGLVIPSPLPQGHDG